MATPKRVEPVRDHVPMSELFASCAAARAVSTPPHGRRGADAHDEDSAYDTYDAYDEAVAYERGAAA